jgi:hypothetical protein
VRKSKKLSCTVIEELYRDERCPTAAHYPIMAGCAFVAAWGLWPEKALHLPFLSGRDVPLEEAALRIYEEDEEKCIEWSMAASGAVSPEAKLKHVKYALLTLDDVTLYGVQPPSTKRCAKSPKTNAGICIR